MENNSFINLKYWSLAFLLSLVTFFSYYVFISGDPYSIYWKLPAILFLSFLVIGVILFRDLTFNLKDKWHFIFVFGILFLNLIFVLYFGIPKYYYMLSSSIDQLTIIILCILIFTVLKPTVLNEILNRYYFIAFVVGVLFLIFTSLNFFGRNEVLNSNTWGLFVAPFLIYLFVTRKGWPLKTVVFL